MGSGLNFLLLLYKKDNRAREKNYQYCHCGACKAEAISLKEKSIPFIYEMATLRSP